MPVSHNTTITPEQAKKFDALLADFIDEMSERESVLGTDREAPTASLATFETIDSLARKIHERGTAEPHFVL